MREITIIQYDQSQIYFDLKIQIVQKKLSFGKKFKMHK